MCGGTCRPPLGTSSGAWSRWTPSTRARPLQPSTGTWTSCGRPSRAMAARSRWHTPLGPAVHGERGPAGALAASGAALTGAGTLLQLVEACRAGRLGLAGASAWPLTPSLGCIARLGSADTCTVCPGPAQGHGTVPAHPVCGAGAHCGGRRVHRQLPGARTHRHGHPGGHQGQVPRHPHRAGLLTSAADQALGAEGELVELDRAEASVRACCSRQGGSCTWAARGSQPTGRCQAARQRHVTAQQCADSPRSPGCGKTASRL